ncbi:MAG TPA: response regulator [Candidatus Limenecus avicola]|uniref:Stage 0 sporulation protein A homolog n=1 Tax=Candidatus Limenecus avicola TaxID=2840847 RepID=A0A9D1MY37_9CLOT|nr:response regulator [Clostridium sp.]HIU91678.1 response regulator [Candidatus Limenecus avicola]
MLSKLVLILDKRKELPAKYKKIIETNGVSVLCASSFETGLEILTEYEPDMVIVSDSLDMQPADAVKRLRMMSYPSRPCIVALSKSAELQDKLDVLDAGADDFLSEPIESDEFKARINAHLRRHFESMISEVTQLPDAKSALKILKRTIAQNKKWAAMLVKINEFEAYKEIYGELASDKMLQTYTAIINSALDENDFLGELTDGEFLVLTNPLKAEHIASFLVYAFEAIVDKFYSEEDAKSGYIILHGDDNAGKRISLVSTSIGIISSEFQTYTSVNAALNALFATGKLARLNTKSSYVVERAKISADNAVLNRDYNNKILILEPDEALNYLLKTTGEMQGYQVASAQDYDIAMNLVKTFDPALIVLDAGEVDTLKGLELCRKLKKDEKYKGIKIVLSTIVHDKKMALNAGADLYLPKPYELLGIFGWIERLVKEFND